MRHSVLACTALIVLGACGDPLAQFDKLSDVAVIDDDPVRAALTEAEPEPASGLLAGLFGRAPVENATTDETVVPVAELGDPDQNSASELVDSAEVSAPSETAPRSGLLGALFKRGGGAIDTSEPTVLPEDAQDNSVEVVASEDEVATPDVTEAPAADRAGLFGLLRRKDTNTALSEPSETVEIAALDASQVESATDLVEPQKRQGLLGGLSLRTAPSDANVREVSVGTPVPFGQVARVCDAKRTDMGKRIEKAGSGKGYALYDTAPDSTGPRTFYVTGFADGCARQFTAALALFGAPSMHEQLRYGLPSQQYPYSETDKAYEKVKSRVCGVARRKPCGGKIRNLERDTVFVSTYERFSNNGRWADILIHDGAVMASAIKAPQ